MISHYCTYERYVDVFDHDKVLLSVCLAPNAR